MSNEAPQNEDAKWSRKSKPTQIKTVNIFGRRRRSIQIRSPSCPRKVFISGGRGGHLEMGWGEVGQISSSQGMVPLFYMMYELANHAQKCLGGF